MEQYNFEKRGGERMNHARAKAETRRNQAAAVGKSVHPRRLARQVAKYLNRRDGQKENEITDFRDMVSRLPKTGKRRKEVRQIRNLS